MISVNFQTRVAVPEDQKQIANLMFFEPHVHRHLDWRAPLDWIGSPFYWILEEDGRVLAVLASPQEPPGVAWVRLFVHASRVSLADAWDLLWRTARGQLARTGGAIAAVICMQQWLVEAIRAHDFAHTQDIVMLELHDLQTVSQLNAGAARLREMETADLPEVSRLDAACFSPLWQNTEEALRIALPQASVATVAEDSAGLLGYQITTANPFGAHLARLAVRPDAQNRGHGTQIVVDLAARLRRMGAARLTVNTQSDNHASLALYRRLGFVASGERFPVFCHTVPDG